MKIGICSIAFKDERIEEIIPKVAKLGYEGIQIWGKHLQDYLKRGNREI